MDKNASAQVSETRLIQFRQDGQTRVAAVKDAETARIVGIQGGTYGFAQSAIEEGRSLLDLIASLQGEEKVSYQRLIDTGALLPPITHPDPAHCCVSGTG